MVNDNKKQKMKFQQYPRIVLIISLFAAFYLTVSFDFSHLPPSRIEKIKQLSHLNRFDNHNEKKELIKEYKFFIDSLWKVDQSIRRSKKYIEARDYIITCKKDSSKTSKDEFKYKHSMELMNEWKKLDSLNSVALIDKMKILGYPSQIIVGKKGFKHAFEILVHFSYRDLQNEFFPILDRALNDSVIKPSMYAYIKDSYLFRYENKQEYYQYQCYLFKDLNELEKEKVLDKRISIGIKQNNFKVNNLFSTWE